MTTAHVGHLRVADVRPRVRVLPDALRIWSALSGLDFGLVTIGIGAGHVEHHLIAAVALVAVGFAAIGWSVLALRGPVPFARQTTLALVVAAPLVLLSAPLTATVPTAAEASALALGLLTAVMTAWQLRLGPDGAAVPSPGRQALVLFCGAMVVATLTVPGLAATNAGEHAVPHGSHGLPAEQHHH
jgi:hypothetical protein